MRCCARGDRGLRHRCRRGPAGIVHRLDRDTVGLIIVARNDRAQAALMAQLKARRVKKTYLALVQGAMPAENGRIEAPIGRDPRHYSRMAVIPVASRQRPATAFASRFPGWSLLEARPDDRTNASDPGPSRVDRARRGRRPDVCNRHRAPGPAGTGAHVPAFMAHRVHVSRWRSRDQGGGAAAAGARDRARDNALADR